MLNVSKPVAYMILIFSICVEIIGCACLEACQAFQDKKLTIALIICYFIAFTLLAKILHIIDLAVGYATWSSVGALGTSLIGMVFFDQKLSIIGWLSILAMSFGVFMLNLYGTPAEEEKRRASSQRRKEKRS